MANTIKFGNCRFYNLKNNNEYNLELQVKVTIDSVSNPQLFQRVGTAWIEGKTNTAIWERIHNFNDFFYTNTNTSFDYEINISNIYTDIRLGLTVETYPYVNGEWNYEDPDSVVTTYSDPITITNYIPTLNSVEIIQGDGVINDVNSYVKNLPISAIKINMTTLDSSFTQSFIRIDGASSEVFFSENWEDLGNNNYSITLTSNTTIDLSQLITQESFFVEVKLNHFDISFQGNEYISNRISCSGKNPTPYIDKVEVLYRDINNTELSLDNNSYIKDYINCSMKIYFTMDIKAEGNYFAVAGGYLYPSSEWTKINEEENKYYIEIKDSSQLQEYFSSNSTNIYIINSHIINYEAGININHESNIISLNAIYKDQVPKVYIDEKFHNCLIKTYKELETGKYDWVICDLPKI